MTNTAFTPAKRRVFALAAVAMAVAWLPLPVLAQGQDFFVPGQARRGAGGPSRPAPARPTPAPTPPPAQGQPTAEAEAPIQAPMPPVPELPPLPRGSTPPAAVVGVIGVPEVMRASAAALQVDRIIGERREKLNADVQKEQQVWRDLQAALTKQRSTLSQEQVRAKERELSDRVNTSQHQFQTRARVIQEATQYGLNQIQSSLIGVIRQVAESHGMNLVLHRQQVALNVNDFDITDQVTEQLNRLLPSVIIPPDGVSPNAPGAATGTPPAASTAPAGATPAAVPPAKAP